MAQEGEDETAADAVVDLRRGEGVGDPCEHNGRRYTAGSVGLKVTEHLGTHDARSRCPCEVGVGQFCEVRFRSQDLHVRVVEVEEVLQAAEGVAAAQVFDVAVRHRDPVAFREGEDELGLEGALQVQVELCERQHPGPSSLVCT